MNFLGFTGNDELKAHLNDAERNGSFSHAYIIWGAGSSGKGVLGDVLSRAFVCTGTGERPCLMCRDCLKSQKHIHPDIINIKKEAGKREILVGQIREIIRDAAVLPNEADKKVFIIEDADDMNSRAQNAFLKLLEEPPSYARFILIGTNPGNFLPTLRSRCVELQTFSAPVPENEELNPVLLSIAESVLHAFKAGDSLTLTSCAAKAGKLDRIQIADFLDILYLITANALKKEFDAVERGNLFAMTDAIQSLMPMCRFNVGSGHITGILAVKLNSIRKEETD
ncbi:MAG: DNA polymerase III subunit [Clostridiales bacterium]|jgi:DNA polymerase III gamma/tau subunit|nr:DNA polymerase III subunit [Clostridiales bacterium]